MKIIVVGAGLVGLTSAYFLQRAGHLVTVLDREPGVGRQTSFANGGLLTPSMSEPWNAPGSSRVLLQSLFQPNAPLQLRPKALPGLAFWGTGFLRNSTPSRYRRNTKRNLNLALYSHDILQALRNELNISYGQGLRGSLRVFGDWVSLADAAAQARDLAPLGLRYRLLDRAEVATLEPGLSPIASNLAGAIHYLSDETGDAHRFCEEMERRARALGVVFQFNTSVVSLVPDHRHVRAARAIAHDFEADQFVVAAGSYSRTLLGTCGLSLPVRPAKGYTVTLPAEDSVLGTPVIDDQSHFVVVPLPGAIRVAGTAEFAGFDPTIPEARIAGLLNFLRRVLPQFKFDPERAARWSGFRPMSMDGVPIIGQSEIDNLFVNSGHGHLGWTMAAGSGQLLCDIVSGKQPAIDASPYAPGRFSSLIRYLC